MDTTVRSESSLEMKRKSVVKPEVIVDLKKLRRFL